MSKALHHAAPGDKLTTGWSPRMMGCLRVFRLSRPALLAQVPSLVGWLGAINCSATLFRFAKHHGGCWIGFSAVCR